jgi:hypothetical protein
MMLEQWAYISEITAAIAVVASLIYVAKQLGQNTAMMRVNASNERVQRDFDISLDIINSREFAEIWSKGDLEFDSLDGIDRIRLIFFERRAILHWHNMFGSRKQKMLTDSDWIELKWVIQNLGIRKSSRGAWTMFKDGYDKSFQEFIDEQFSIADKSRDTP